MTRMLRLIAVLLFVLPLTSNMMLAQAPTAPPDISGKWAAAIETQVGTFNYTYVFKVEAGKLTGTADNAQGSKSELTAGKVDGKTVTFVENLKFMEMEIVVTYTGTIVSVDEIKFTRNVGEFATEELVAKRSKN